MHQQNRAILRENDTIRERDILKDDIVPLRHEFHIHRGL